MYAVIVY